jgi:hypothetical protein
MLLLERRSSLQNALNSLSFNSQGTHYGFCGAFLRVWSRSRCRRICFFSAIGQPLWAAALFLSFLARFAFPGYFGILSRLTISNCSHYLHYF